MTKKANSDFVFRKHMSIGEAEAEADEKFLSSCFVDIGDFETLCDTQSPQCIVLGRTGVGKSALLEYLEDNSERVIRIQPEELAIKHVSNSTILKFFEDIGVNLDIFYNLLWQHTFAIELIKKQYGIDSPTEKANFLTIIKEKIIGDSKKQLALQYFEEWGDKFWLDTESRIKEVTEKLEANLKAEVKKVLPGFNLSSALSTNLSDEQKTEFIHFGKKVVSEVQIAKLSKIIGILGEDIFTDDKQKTYIIIDKLDENWVDDSLRYKLIRALIETVKKFRTIRPVKIIFTLRTDLLDRVLEHTRDAGFQKEKYTNLFLTIRWSKQQIKELLDKRINSLLKHKYTKSDVSFDDIFPTKMDQKSGSDYIIDRTLLRPRDAIIFVNLCLLESEGQSEITSAIVKRAEKTYSHNRIESLEYEWFVEHPFLSLYIETLHHKSNKFKVSSIKNEELDSLIIKLAENFSSHPDIVTQAALDYLKSNYPQSDEMMIKFKQNLLYTLYKVGAVGIKVDGTSSILWVNNRTENLTPHKIVNNSIIYIHNFLWNALAIDSRS